ncbi:hypothetical protein AB6C94_11250 [Vibrio splendidus]|uniref:hypothetical protein n=1 Tax=Vibrio splendidus TaxID=29497 RepID=UPI000313A096|nr:hypothetical protein [Vibrio splendidus]OEF76065.1 hypothetical protein A148_16130 [Vibrio splendidus 1F-157]PTP71748.1 hypothetical protein CWO23_08650 [Vibrio splendidus]
MSYSSFKAFSNDTERNLRTYIRYLNKNSDKGNVTAAENLHNLDKKKLKNIFVEEIAKRLNIKNGDLTEGRLDCDDEAELEEILTDLYDLKTETSYVESKLTWVTESENTRAAYFFLSVFKMMVKNNERYFSYPATYLSTCENTKGDTDEDGLHQERSRDSSSDSLNRLKAISNSKVVRSVKNRETDFEAINSVLKICPNKSDSFRGELMECLENYSTHRDFIGERGFTEIVDSIETVYDRMVRELSTINWDILKEQDEKMVDWLYAILTKKHEYIPLSPADDLEKKKSSIRNVIDLLYVTNGKEDFEKITKSIRDSFSRRKKSLSVYAIELDQERLDKLVKLAGGSKGKVKIQKALFRLIDSTP